MWKVFSASLSKETIVISVRGIVTISGTLSLPGAQPRVESIMGIVAQMQPWKSYT